MNYNIALSSFIYILIFIFPGVLFRKFYYNGPFTKQFNNGNLFERFIITLFLSVISVTLSGLIIILLRDVLNIPFLPSISYRTVFNVLNTLQENKLPDPAIFSKTYKDFLILLLLMFSLSGILGAFCYMIVTALKLDQRMNVFKFNDKWHYHVKGKNNSKIKNEKYLYTEANVLVQDGNSDKVMYSGYLNDYTVDENNSIKSVLLEETHRYTYDQLQNNDVDRERPIRGSIMYIACENVMNINFTHIFEPKVKKTFREKVFIFLNISFLLIYAATFILFWMDNVVWHFDKFWKKTIFIIFSILIEILTYNFLKDFLSFKFKSIHKPLYYFEGLLIASGPVIYSMGLLSGWWILSIIFLGTVFIEGYFMFLDLEKEKKKKQRMNLIKNRNLSRAKKFKTRTK